MDKVFFKIIIPNYNNMPYIQKCLDSILNQTFQDFKIILVDDLSTDMSYEFAQMYERKYKNKIIVIQLKEKGYAGTCRNIGIDYPIDSKYTMTIDSDDWLFNNDVLKKLYLISNNYTYDAIFFSAYRYYNGIIEKATDRKKIDLTDSKFCDPTYHTCKIVKSKLFEKYLENICVGQDLYHSYKCLDKIKKYLNIDDCMYVYNINQNSISNVDFYSEKFLIREKHRLILIDRLKDLKNKIQNTNIKLNIDNRINILNKKAIYENNKIKDKIVIALASFPERKKGMLRVIDQLYNQCDIFCLWLNDYSEIPSELNKYNKSKLIIKLAKENSNIKENGRLFWITNFYNSYYLTVDDDINYPNNYVEKIIQSIKKYNKKCIVSYHGAIFKDGIEKIYGFQYSLKNDIQVHRIGGGVCGFVPSEIKIQIPTINQLQDYDGDASISVWATNNNIKKICLARDKNWLSEIYIDNERYSFKNALCLNLNTKKKRLLIYKKLINGWEKI